MRRAIRRVAAKIRGGGAGRGRYTLASARRAGKMPAMRPRHRCFPALRAPWFFAPLGLLLGLAISAPAVRATTVVPPDFAELVNGSDFIVRAVVKSVSAVKKPGARGSLIFTRVELEVAEVVAGTPPAQLTLEMLGGRVGEQELTVEGAPRFQVGDEDILFVSGNGRNLSPLYGMMHGRYPVLKDATTGRAFVARSNLAPLRSTAEIGQPMGERTAAAQRSPLAAADALTPEEFIRQIKATAKLRLQP